MEKHVEKILKNTGHGSSISFSHLPLLLWSCRQTFVGQKTNDQPLMKMEEMATAAASLKKKVYWVLGKKSPAIYVNKQKIALHEP